MQREFVLHSMNNVTEGSDSAPEILSVAVLSLSCLCLDIAATPLPKSYPWNRRAVVSYLHQNETGNVCRVREGKLGC